MAEKLTPERLIYGFKAAADPQISPDGARIVYSVTETSAETKKATSHLWIADIDGGNARQLTGSGTSNGWPGLVAGRRVDRVRLRPRRWVGRVRPAGRGTGRGAPGDQA